MGKIVFEFHNPHTWIFFIKTNRLFPVQIKERKEEYIVVDYLGAEWNLLLSNYNITWKLFFDKDETERLTVMLDENDKPLLYEGDLE